jgi:rod shape-determining protein MreC
LFSLLKRYRELIVVGALLLYPFARFLTAGGRGREPNFLDRAVIWISSPIASAMTFTIDGADSLWQGYVALRGVHAENEMLVAENRRLTSELNAFIETRAENERLKTLLAYTQSQPGVSVAARVIGTNPVMAPLSVRINRGENAGVLAGMPVVTSEGVVGHVVRSTGGYADVMLLTDRNSKIGVRVQTKRSQATAAGAGDQPLRLENAKRLDDFADGDVLVTSGTDALFPPGLVVGKIQKLDRKNFGLFQTAEIVPAVDTTRLEEVLVITTPVTFDFQVAEGSQK